MLIDWANTKGAIVLPLLGTLKPWQFVFVALGLPGLLIVPLIFLTPPTGRAAPAAPAVEGGQAGFLASLRTRARYLACHSLGCAIISMIDYGTTFRTPTFFVRRFGMDLLAIGVRLGTMQLAMSTLGFLLSGWIADRWFARGARDAHLRYFVFAAPIISVAGVAAFLHAPRRASLPCCWRSCSC